MRAPSESEEEWHRRLQDSVDQAMISFQQDLARIQFFLPGAVALFNLSKDDFSGEVLTATPQQGLKRLQGIFEAALESAVQQDYPKRRVSAELRNKILTMPSVGGGPSIQHKISSMQPDDLAALALRMRMDIAGSGDSNLAAIVQDFVDANGVFTHRSASPFSAPAKDL